MAAPVLWDPPVPGESLAVPWHNSVSPSPGWEQSLCWQGRDGPAEQSALCFDTIRNSMEQE